METDTRSNRRDQSSGLSSRTKHLISICMTLAFIICAQFLQFNSSARELILNIKKESNNELISTASNSLRSTDHYIIPTSNTNAVAQSDISAQKSFSQLKRILFQCGGDHEEPLQYWTYYFECDDKRLLPSSDMTYMLAQGKSISNTGPKVRFNGTDVGFAGQAIDFIVAELFFMHPSPQYEGRYLEIGGYFGLEYSNSLFFEQYLGWDGWLFEPTTCYDEMVENRPKATSFRQGLCSQSVQDMTFAGFGSKCQTANAPCIPLTSMDGWEDGFDFVSIDVEGAEMNVMEAIDFSKVKIKVLAIEWRPENGDVREEYLKQFGYEKVVRFQWQGWGNADEIFYRPDLVKAHVFDANAKEELVSTASNGLRSTAAENTGLEPTSDTQVLTQPDISVQQSYFELRKILFECGGDHEEPLQYWTYYFDCDDKRLLPSSDMTYMLAQGKSISNTGPKVRFNGTDIGFAGQTIDFIVAELFFMHPSPQYEGRYLEIGGYYGLEYSNSLFFEQYLGWDGWLFEPTTCYDEMVENRPKATSFRQGLCSQSVQDMTFAGFGSKCQTANAPCIPLTSMDGWEDGFDFVSIDVEGAEMNVMEAVDFSKVKIKVLAIEWRPENGDVREEYLKQFGYEKVVRFQWQGWGNADEIFYRPDLVKAHVFDASAKQELSYASDVKQSEIISESKTGSVIVAEHPQQIPAELHSTTSTPSYEPTYQPTESGNDASDENVGERLVWETIGDIKGHVFHGEFPQQKCHVIENVCHGSSDKSWYYFNESEDNGFELKHRIAHPRQPLLEYSTGHRTRITINSSSLNKNSSWIKEQQCIISPIEDHVVLNGDHIHMMGEYIQRIILPLHHLLEDYAQHSEYKDESVSGKEIQFYINFHQNENQKILPSHHLYMNGLQYGQDLQSWSETLDPTYKTSSPPCKCYSRLIFCGFKAHGSGNVLEIAGLNDTVKQTTMSASSAIPWDLAKHCAHYMAPISNLTNEDCQVWQDFRKSLIQTYHNKNPNLSQDIEAYRTRLIQGAGKYTNATVDFEKHPLKDWKIIALSQRRVWRMWLNLNETLAHCNSKYFANQIVCIGLDVEDLPTNFISVGSNQPLSSMDEQFVLYQSINALIGIHGSQLTQGILMPPGSAMVELFQWIPKDWGYVFWGDGWTNQKNHPTPMGIMWHNTDINEAGWNLPLESFPFCQNVSDSKIHNFSSTPDDKSQKYWTDQKRNGAAGNTTELEYCLAVQNGDQFRWDRRNFNVGLDFFEKFIDTFYPSRAITTNTSAVLASESEVPSCDKWRTIGEGNGFVLYNLICKGENGTVKPHHYYHSRR